MATSTTVELTLGETTLTYGKENIVDAKLVREVDPLSAELPISAVELSIRDTSGSLSMFSGTAFQLSYDRPPLLVTETINGVDRLIGKFYLDTWKNQSAYRYDFRAVDIIGVLETVPFDGIFWSSPVTITQAFQDVLDPFGVEYEIDADLLTATVSGWIAPGTLRLALQQILFAVGGMASTAGATNLQIKPFVLPDITETYDYRIRDGEKSDQESVDLLPLVTSIELQSHNYTAGTDVETIFDKVLPVGSHKIVFSKPYYNIVVDGPGYIPVTLVTEDGVDIVLEDGVTTIEVGGQFVFGPNSLFLTLQAEAEIIVTGYPWVDSQRAFTFTEDGNPVTKNALKIDGATLVSDALAQAALDRVRDYNRLRYTKQIRVFMSEERTISEVGDIVGTSTLYEKTLLGKIRRMDIDLAGGCVADTYLVGTEAVYVPNSLSPVRVPRCGVAGCGVDLTRNNGFRLYD